MKEQSVFLKVLAGELPGEVLYEDDRVFVMLTVAPNTPGHSLVVPKKQTKFFYEMNGDEFAEVMDVARRFATILNDVYQPKVVAAQLMGLGVPHVHVHLVPIEDEKDMDHERGLQFVDMSVLKPEADKIRTYLADHPLGEIQ
jgi:diadenosine tetraphosphate (Ap4A) HIT family hydrolase